MTFKVKAYFKKNREKSMSRWIIIIALRVGKTDDAVRHELTIFNYDPRRLSP